MYNPDFKGIEFDTFKVKPESNSFRLTPKKCEINDVATKK